LVWAAFEALATFAGLSPDCKASLVRSGGGMTVIIPKLVGSESGIIFWVFGWDDGWFAFRNVVCVLLYGAVLLILLSSAALLLLSSRAWSLNPSRAS
jgi:hypothetical protein